MQSSGFCSGLKVVSLATGTDQWCEVQPTHVRNVITFLVSPSYRVLPHNLSLVFLTFRKT